jgi:hypothetical protein
MTVLRRRFPPPWSVEELEACFAVRDHDGQQLVYVYFGEEPARDLTLLSSNQSRTTHNHRVVASKTSSI